MTLDGVDTKAVTNSALFGAAVALCLFFWDQFSASRGEGWYPYVIAGFAAFIGGLMNRSGRRSCDEQAAALDDRRKALAIDRERILNEFKNKIH